VAGPRRRGRPGPPVLRFCKPPVRGVGRATIAPGRCGPSRCLRRPHRPPYRSLRSLGGADAPGSGLRPARPGAGLAPRDRWLSVVRDSPPSQAMCRANGRPAGRCARPSSRRTAWGLPCGELRPCWLVVVRGAVSGGALRLTPTAASPPRPDTWGRERHAAGGCAACWSGCAARWSHLLPLAARRTTIRRHGS
jgi:hypothetical protein